MQRSLTVRNNSIPLAKFVVTTFLLFYNENSKKTNLQKKEFLVAEFITGRTSVRVSIKSDENTRVHTNHEKRKLLRLKKKTKT